MLNLQFILYQISIQCIRILISYQYGVDFQYLQGVIGKKDRPLLRLRPHAGPHVTRHVGLGFHHRPLVPHKNDAVHITFRGMVSFSGKELVYV